MVVTALAALIQIKPGRHKMPRLFKSGETKFPAFLAALTQINTGGPRPAIHCGGVIPNRGCVMAETIAKLPVKNAQTPPSVGHPLRPFLGLRQEIERLFDEFDRGLWTSPFRRSLFEPFWRQETGSMTAPAVDVAETENAYEITAELPRLDPKKRRGEVR